MSIVELLQGAESYTSLAEMAATEAPVDVAAWPTPLTLDPPPWERTTLLV